MRTIQAWFTPNYLLDPEGCVGALFCIYHQEDCGDQTPAPFRYDLNIRDLIVCGEEDRQRRMNEIAEAYTDWVLGLDSVAKTALYEQEGGKAIMGVIIKEFRSRTYPFISEASTSGPTDLSNPASPAFDPLEAVNEGNSHDKRRSRGIIDGAYRQYS